MDRIKGIMGMGLAVMLMAGGATVTTVSLAQAADAPAAKQESKPAGGEKKDIKQGDKPAASEDKSRGFKKGQKATETMGTMGKEKAKEETKP
jgi:hypothetical protein